MVITARCGCSASGCTCRFNDLVETNCITVSITGNGSDALPYNVQADPVIDPNPANILTCGVGGLFVPGDAAINMDVDPGSCLEISGTGTLLDPFIFTTTASQDDLAPFSKSGVLTAPYTGVGRFRFPFAATIVGVSAAVNTAPVGSTIILDVNKNGVSIFPVSTKPIIAIGAFDTGPAEVVPDTLSIVSGDYLTVDIDQVGSGTPGSELSVFVHYTRPITCTVIM